MYSAAGAAGSPLTVKPIAGTEFRWVFRGFRLPLTVRLFNNCGRFLAVLGTDSDFTCPAGRWTLVPARFAIRCLGASYGGLPRRDSEMAARPAANALRQHVATSPLSGMSVPVTPVVSREQRIVLAHD